MVIWHISIASELNILKRPYKVYKDITSIISFYINQGNKNIPTNTFTKQVYHSIICGYLCIGFAEFMLKRKICLEYKKLFSPSEYEVNFKIIQ